MSTLAPELLDSAVLVEARVRDALDAARAFLARLDEPEQ